MTGKVIDSGATGFLVLIIPIALIAVVVATAWPILLALLLIIIVWQIWQQWQWQRFVGKVNPAFNQLIRENKGCITPVDLAMKANIEGNKANKFLEYKATEFSAKSREIPNQGKVYYFLTASAVENFFEEPEPLETLETEEENDTINSAIADQSSQSASELDARNFDESSSHLNHNIATATPVRDEASHHLKTTETEEQTNLALIQAELARRLQVHSSTVGKRKLDPDFADWTRNRDPENISWQYSDETKLFYPLDEE
ncbi:MAG: hypothetical protein BRC33_08265 [Cyanobacteria bacterium SW_9_44_58]|nr:MAG: hypothetical protein BRC33_08265 [Cyanobacteria bacterium SW_9_44_58]